MDIKDIKNKYYIAEKETIQPLFNECNLEAVDNLGNTLLHIACFFVDSKAVEMLIEKGLDTNSQNNNQERPLHTLINHEDDFGNDEEFAKCAKLLLENGASAIRKEINGWTPTILAAQKANLPVIEALIANEAKLSFKDKEGNSPLHIVALNFDDRNKEKYLKIAQLLLKSEQFDLEDKNNDDLTPLDIAKKRDLNELAKVLAGDLGDGMSGDDNLYKAIIDKNYDQIETILKIGFDPNSTVDESSEYKNMTMLGLAAYLLDSKAVEILLANGADPNFKNADGLNSLGHMLLFDASLNFDYTHLQNNTVKTIFDLLVKNGLDVNQTVDNNENSGLIKACKHLNQSAQNDKTLAGLIASYLLKNKCDVNKTNKDGQSALMFCSLGQREEALNLAVDLMEKDAKVDQVDKFGNTCLIYASQNTKNFAIANEIVEMLYEFGDPLTNQVNNDKKTALDYASQNANEKLVKLILTNM